MNFNINIAQNITISGPSGFGNKVTVLTNGNYVVRANFNNKGAIYLYKGSDHTLISSFSGTKNTDFVGSGGVFALTNGNFVVCSPSWCNGSKIEVGAVTWVNGTTGMNDTISVINSIIGSNKYDWVGYNGIVPLTNGNFCY
ncbi:MAG: hypothetical protein IPK03_06710 [Bacteroidetes bacterium]|nr:hypothetical protein [Bacteroidota bacterium]